MRGGACSASVGCNPERPARWSSRRDARTGRGVADGVRSLSPWTVEAHYFDWHHTEADTLDKVDPVEFRKNAAMLSVVAYVLADMDGRLAGRKSAAAE